MYSFSEVQNYDPDLAKAMADETQRQRDKQSEEGKHILIITHLMNGAILNIMTFV